MKELLSSEITYPALSEPSANSAGEPPASQRRVDTSASMRFALPARRVSTARGWSMSFSNPFIWISTYSKVFLEGIKLKSGGTAGS